MVISCAVNKSKKEPTQESSRPHERTCRVTSPYVTSPEKLQPMRQGGFADTRRKKSLQLDQTHQEEQLSVSDIVSPKTPSLADRRIPYRILQTELRRFSSRSNTSLLSTEYEQATASPPPGCHIVGEPVARRSSRPNDVKPTETRQTQQASSWHAPRTDSATSRERFPDPLCSATKLQRGHRNYLQGTFPRTVAFNNGDYQAVQVKWLALFCRSCKTTSNATC